MKGHHMLFKDGKKFISEISQSSSSARNVVNKEHIQIRYGSLMPLFWSMHDYPKEQQANNLLV